MNPVDRLMLALEKKPHQTALDLWVELSKIRIKNPAAWKEIKDALPNDDQSIREIMAIAEKKGMVKHRIKWKSILKEWSLCEK
jgi:hypothetical protein